MPKRKCQFTDNLKKKYPCFDKFEDPVTQKTDPFKAYCKLCNANVSVANGGAPDLDHHVQSKKHRENVQGASTSKSMNNFVIRQTSPLMSQICAAEATLAFHVVVHHLSFRSQDCNAALLRTLFHDSKIASQLTKTKAIICSVISPHVRDIVHQDLQKASFVSIDTDGSNYGHIILFPIVVQYFDYTQGGVTDKILDLHEMSDEKADTISKAIESTVKKHGLEEKLVVFAADNTNSNFGGLNRRGDINVLALLKKKMNSHLLGVGCAAHILHSSVQHGLNRFGIFDIDALAFKIYQHFSIYTVRVENLKAFCEFVEVAFRELLYHSKTRWLSLMPVIHRILQMFPALKSYFWSEEKPPVFLQSFFQHELSECFLLFVHSLMSLFHENLKELEKESNSIVEILNIVDRVAQGLRDRIENNFVTPSIKKILSQLREDGEKKECEDFLQRIQMVYVEAEEYLLKWTASLSEFRIFQWMDFQRDTLFTFSSIEDSIAYLQGKKVEFEETRL